MRRYQHIKAGTPGGLEKAVDEFLFRNPDWDTEGGPLEDAARGDWIQAVKRKGVAPADGEIRLKEPKRR